jgi:Glyoxalase/Bleomycin resistance protein/Dioxygenase superfamily
MSGFPHRPIVQIGFAVKDPRAAALRFHEQTGAGPFYVADHFAIDRARHGDQDAVFEHSAAFGQWGSVMVEMIAQHEVSPPALAEILEPERPRLHHMTWFAPDLDMESARLEAAGWPCILDVTTEFGVRFLFHDAQAELGHLIELYEAGPRVSGHYTKVAAAAAGWDGTRPVREIAELA